MGTSVGQNCIYCVQYVLYHSVVCCYVEHTAPFRYTEQLFVCYGEAVSGKALSKKCLTSPQAYMQADKDPPTVV